MIGTCVAEKIGNFKRSQKGSCIKPLANQLERDHFIKVNKKKKNVLGKEDCH